MDTFRKELSGLINKHNKDTEANTPDFILAEFLYSCLWAYIMAKREHDNWIKKGE